MKCRICQGEGEGFTEYKEGLTPTFYLCSYCDAAVVLPEKARVQFFFNILEKRLKEHIDEKID